MFGELTEGNKKTLEFLKAVCEQALIESRAGNTALVNALSRKSTAFAYYFADVHTRGVMTPEQFAQQMPSQLGECELLRQDYEHALKISENDQRLSNIEEALSKLPNLLKEQIALVMKPEPKRKGKGKEGDEEESE